MNKILSLCRHILASLHFNENLRRKTKKRKDGTTYVNVAYPKFKMGEEVVREVAEPPTYGNCSILQYNLLECQFVKNILSMFPKICL